MATKKVQRIINSVPSHQTRRALNDLFSKFLSFTDNSIDLSDDVTTGITLGGAMTNGINVSGVCAACINMATPSGAIFKMVADDTIVSDANQAILVDISATANAGFIKVILDTSTVKYIALYDAKAS